MARTIQTRLILFVLLIFLPVIALLVWADQQQRAQASQSARREATRLTEIVAVTQAEQIEGGRQVLLTLAGMRIITQGDREACDALFADLLKNYTGFTNIYAVEADGDTACTGLPAPPDFNVADLEWFQDTMRTEEFTVGRFSLGRLTGLPILTLGYPVYLEDGTLWGAVGLGLSLDWLTTVINVDNLPPDSSLFLLDRDGVVLTAYNPNTDIFSPSTPESERVDTPRPNIVLGQPHPLDGLTRAVTTRHTGNTRLVGLDGRTRIFAFRPMQPPEAQAFVVIGFSEDVLLQDLRDIESRTLFGLFLVSVAALLVAGWGSATIAQPLNNFISTSQRMAEGDLSARVTSPSTLTEIRQLAQTFNLMADSVERRVDERTLDLQQAVERTANLQSITAALSVAVLPQEVAAVIIDRLYPALGAHRGLIAAFDKSGERLIVLQDHGSPPEMLALFPMALTLHDPVAEVARTRQPVWVETEAAYRARYPLLFQAVQPKTQTRSFACLPLEVGNRLLGVLSVSFREEQVFTPETRTYLHALVDNCAQALERAALYHQAREQRERLRVTLTSIGDAVIATDTHKRVTFMNRVAVALTGWKEEEAIGQPLDDVFHIINEGTRALVESPVEKVLREGKVIGLANHTLLIRKDGHELPIDDSGAPIRDGDGEIMGVILVFRDISERRAVEQAEREQRALAEALRDSALAMSASLELTEVLDLILAGVERVIPHDAANIMLLEEGHVFVARQRGYRERGLTAFANALDEIETPLEDIGPLSPMISDRQPIIENDIRNNRADVMLGERTDYPAMSYLGTPIMARGQVIGVLNLNSFQVGFFTPDHAERLQVFAAQVAVALQNARAYQQAQQIAVLEERHRLARDLHDAVSQMLFSSSIIAEALPRMLETSPDKLLPQLDHLQRLNRGALAEMRNLLVELRESRETRLDLRELLAQLAQVVMGQTSITAHVQIEGEAQLPQTVQLTFYRIAQEALNNVVKHARAEDVYISLRLDVMESSLSIRDNGQGFEMAKVNPTRMGLNIMQERVNSIKAALSIVTAPGQGTEIIVTWAAGAG